MGELYTHQTFICPCETRVGLEGVEGCHLFCLQEAYFCGLAHEPTLHRVAVEVVTTMTSADVMWQDGSVECNIRSNDLFPVHHLDNNEFCPGDFVVDKRGSAALQEVLGV